MSDRRVFFTVHDPATVLHELETGLFVPTRLSLGLGERLEVGLRLPRVKRSLDVPVIVLGRRLPRPGSLLSAGVVVRLEDREHPAVDVLRDAINPHIVDLEARIQERLRLPATLTYPSLDDARTDLAAMLNDGAMVRFDQPFARGDRLSLRLHVAGGEIERLNVVVRRLHIHRADTQVVVQALGDADRRAIQVLLTPPVPHSRQA